MTKALFDQTKLGMITLKNRVVMAPMTRARAPNTIADAQTALYYQQRASAGLIVTEGTPVSREGQGFVAVPGIWSEPQIKGWAAVTDAVHQDGGVIFAQLWHVGRVSHTSLQPDGRAPVSASAKPATDPRAAPFAIREDGTAGFVPASVPRPLETDEVRRVVSDFADAAANAQRAEFDGVELHGANGYLFEQFLNPLVNERQDRYGVTLEGRARFLLEAVDAVVARIGSDKVAIRLSPFGQVSDMPAYDETTETYLYLAQALSERKLAYVHLMDQQQFGSPIPADFLAQMRAAYAGTLILAGGLTLASATDLVTQDLIDLAAFGQPFISNPDLVDRFRRGAALTPAVRETFFGGGAEGYTSYPKAQIAA